MLVYKLSLLRLKAKGLLTEPMIGAAISKGWLTEKEAEEVRLS